jgi:hypothetical protein
VSFTAVLYGLLGFMAGWLVGNFWGVGKREPAPTKASPRRTSDAKPKRWSREQWIGPVVLLLALLMGVQYMVQVNRERDYTTCQTSFNSAFAKQLSIRSELASQAQANVDQIILSIGKLVLPDNVTPTPAEQRERAAEYRKLFRDFATESAEISKRRAATPLPKLPDCGDVEAGAMPVTLAAEQARVESLEAELDASRAMILAAQDATPETTAKPAETKQPAPVRTVVVREPATPSKAPPPVLLPPVVVTLPAPEAPKPVAVPIASPAEPSCLLNLLGVCVDL